MKLDDLVRTYVQLRDKKRKMNDDFKTSMVPVNLAMEKVESLLLDFLNRTGQQSANTNYGTAFKAAHKSITVGDAEAFMAWVFENPEERRAFLEDRVCSSAVEEYVEKYSDLPPGIKFTSEVVVRVKAPTVTQKRRQEAAV